MNTTISLNAALVATVVSGLIIFATRAFPFVVFSKKEPPRILRFIEKYIPPMIMAILLVYCLKDVQFTNVSSSVPTLVALAVTVILHLWRHNSLISIFGGTALYMVLMRVM